MLVSKVIALKATEVTVETHVVSVAVYLSTKFPVALFAESVELAHFVSTLPEALNPWIFPAKKSAT